VDRGASASVGAPFLSHSRFTGWGNAFAQTCSLRSAYGVGLSGCSENQANNGFEKELTSEQHKASIKQLQNEAAWGEVSKP
jgi:hypothetical protein